MTTRTAGQMVAFAIPNIHEVYPRKVDNNEVELYGARTGAISLVVPKLNDEAECLQSCVFVERLHPMLAFVSSGNSES
jgi:hypothetical protein